MESTVKLKPGGIGSMDLTVALAGYFTLKGKPQSVTIDLPTEPGEGTRLNGFELHLQEVDAVKAFVINDLEAKYNAEEKDLAGSANISLPFFAKGAGAGVGLRIQNGILTNMQVSAHGVDIPIGAAGSISDLDGGFSFQGEAPLDFNGYCRSQGYEGAVLVGPEHGTFAITNWKCHKGNQNDGIEVGKACQWQSKNPAGHAEYRDPNDANSWKCIGMPVTHLGSDNIQLDLIINANASAVFGAPRASPFGDIRPIGVDAGLNAGYTGDGLLVKINGGLKVFRLPVGDAHVILHANSGVDVGFGLGMGLPSYKNNPDDPFYVGLGLDGWIGKGMYQLEGKGRVALFGVKLLDADGLVNDKAVGACWVVLGAAGGAVYRWGDKAAHDFGFNSCGLGDYREQFPSGARISADRGRRFTLSARQKTLAVHGAGAAPRFTLRSDNGRVFRTPTDKPGVLTDDHAFFLNDGTNQTHVILRDPKGSWTITPEHGSVITGVKAAGNAPKEHVTAKLRGHGIHRTLVWHSLNRPRTTLVFTEVLPGGLEIPLLRTPKGSGRKRIIVATHGHYGKRRLRVVVVQGHASYQSAVTDRYRVNRPRLLPAPRTVVGVRNEHDVLVRWSGVRGARGYLVQVVMYQHHKLVSSYVRRVSAKRRRALIPDHPGGGQAIADVFALNVDDRPGIVGKDAFPTNTSVRTLKAAARLDAGAAVLRRKGVVVRTRCPRGGHCRTTLAVVLGHRRLAGESYQQTPDTFHRQLIALRRSVVRRLRGDRRNLRVVVKVHRTGERGVASGPVSR